MNKTNDKKVCSFFVSDYHFEMISLPYIERELEKNKKIVVLTDEDLTETVQKLLSNINLKVGKKNKLMEIDWSNKSSEKIRNIENEEQNNILILIKGKENYINDMKRNIKNLIQKDNVECIDCYDVNEIGNDVARIAKQYNVVLNTMGKSII